MKSDVVVTGFGEIAGADGRFRDGKRADPFARVALEAARTAVCQAALDFAGHDPFRCGVVIASAFGGMTTVRHQCRILQDRGPDRVSALLIPGMIINSAAGTIATHFQLRGPGLGLCADTNGLAVAVREALRWIHFGLADIVIAGEANWDEALSGADSANVCPGDVVAMPQSNAPLTTDGPQTPENGALILVVERRETAFRRGARTAQPVVSSTTGVSPALPEPAEIQAALNSILSGFRQR